MRILFVTPYYIPAYGFGGPVKVVADLARSLRKQGHEVTIATTDALDLHRRIAVKEDVIEGTTVHYFPNITTEAALRWNIYWPRGFRSWLAGHIHDFDVIHCHDFFTGLNIVVSDSACKAKVPYIVHPHGALIPIRQHARFTLSKRLWLRFFSKVLRRAAFVVASTEKEREEILANQHVPSSRVVVLPNGLDVEEVGRPLRDERILTHYGIQPNEPVVLYFGRLQFMKGLDISLRSLALIRELPWKYLIVGRDDGERSRLEKLAQQLGIADRILFLGPQFGKNLDRTLGLSALFLFNSRSESFPIAVLQACAAGLPAVLSPECRIPEVQSAQAGIVLTENTPEKTAQALRELLMDPERRLAMSQAGQRLVKEVFSLERVIDACLDLYQKSGVARMHTV